MKKICLTGGGTAGHVMPNLALCEELQKKYNLIYIGSKKGMEKKLVEGSPLQEISQIPFYSISTGKLKRYHALSNFSMPFDVIKGIFEAKKILKQEKPDIIFSKGGFVSVPVVIAAKFLHIPVVLHEADITPGLANKICIPFSKKICTSFESTINLLPKKKAIYTGLPIRKAIIEGDKEKGKFVCNFSNNKKLCLLVIGGSSGSVFINNIIRRNLSKLTQQYNIIHICGKSHIDNEIKNDSYKQFEFVDKELSDLYAFSDLIIARAGANILYEIMALGKLNLLIPLSKNASRGDQIDNASSMEDAGLSLVLLEEALKTTNGNKVFCNAINYLFDNKEKYYEKLNKWKKFDSTKEIIKVIKSILDNK